MYNLNELVPNVEKLLDSLSDEELYDMFKNTGLIYDNFEIDGLVNYDYIDINESSNNNL